MNHYVISLRRLEAEYGITLENLLDQGLVSSKGAAAIREGKCKAITATFINAVCNLAGCEPEVFFEKEEQQ